MHHKAHETRTGSVEVQVNNDHLFTYRALTETGLLLVEEEEMEEEAEKRGTAVEVTLHVGAMTEKVDSWLT